MTVEWEEGFSIRVDFEKDKKISRQAEFFRLTAVLYFYSVSIKDQCA